MNRPERYHPLLVSLHWLTAILMFFMLAYGVLVLKRLPNESSKLMPLAIHAIGGILILVITLARAVVRFSLPRPAPATTGSKLLDGVGHLTHALLYLGALGMGISGLGIAIQAGLFDMIVSGTWTMTGGFFQFPPRVGHQYLAWGLIALIMLHVGAALYHQIIRRDGLLKRMTFGRKTKPG